MNKAEDNFIVNRLKAFKYAFKGAWLLIRKEPSIKVQFTCAIIVTLLGFILDISATEWVVQLLAIGLVLAVEGLNTAVEKIADFIHPEYHEKIGDIKDVAAGAVTFAALIAAIIGLIIYIPKLL
ncbi:diacylglycerol kinase family protein [Leeuwenhoekiella sp. MAR_2009_132]|uniref:diacylglycerol kinase family protein n=1 Tax=Leeuwenhoekiella sp. MAR_2009_132 TaxID=1392489 RepID=UPI00048EC4AE|nr:diacylglycerol kinase family protein [Leeuwenhoekiella sp. MAR_2009_132]